CDVPHVELLGAERGQEPAVGGEDQRVAVVLVPWEPAQLLPRGDIPQHDLATPQGHRSAIGRKGQTVDIEAGRRARSLARGDVPQVESFWYQLVAFGVESVGGQCLAAR